MPDAELQAMDIEVHEKVMGVLPREVRVRGSDQTVTIRSDNSFYQDGVCNEHELRWAKTAPAFAEEIELAWEVVKKLAELDWRLALMAPGGFTDEGLMSGPEWTAVFKRPEPDQLPGESGIEHCARCAAYHDTGYGTGATAPLAICRAALAAVGQEQAPCPTSHT